MEKLREGEGKKTIQFQSANPDRFARALREGIKFAERIGHPLYANLLSQYIVRVRGTIVSCDPRVEQVEEISDTDDASDMVDYTILDSLSHLQVIQALIASHTTEKHFKVTNLKGNAAPIERFVVAKGWKYQPSAEDGSIYISKEGPVEDDGNGADVTPSGNLET